MTQNIDKRNTESSKTSVGRKLKHISFHLCMRTKFLISRVREQWNRLSREVVEALSVKKTCLEVILFKLL